MNSDTVRLTDHSTFQVYYEDTDFTGYVYHANYLKYFERAREHMLGIAYLKELFRKKIHFVVHKMDITYHWPARHGDTIEVESLCQISGSPVVVVEQKALLPKHCPPGPKELVTAKIKLVAVNEIGQPIRIPDSELEVIRAMRPAQPPAAQTVPTVVF